MPDLLQYKNRNLWLFLILLLGFSLRVYRLDRHGIWADEKWCISTAVGVPHLMMENSYYKFNGDSSAGSEYVGDGSLKILKNKKIFSSKDFWHFNTTSQVIEATIYANNSILYFLTLHYWIEVFGVSDFSTRFLSLIFGMLTILMVYFIAKILFEDFKIALLAALFAALCPLLIFVCQESKSHAMATFFATMATFFFIKIFLNIGKKYSFVWYGLAVAAALLSHMLTIHIFFGHALVMLFYSRKKEAWVKYILSNIGAVGIYLFWLVNGGMQGIEFLAQFDSSAMQLVKHWKPGDNPFYMPAHFVSVLKGCVQILLPLFGNGAQNLGLSLGKLLPLLLIPFIFLWIGFTKAKNNERQVLSILLVILFTEVLFIIILSFIKGHIILFQPIYGSMNGIPYAMIILAFAIAQIISYNRKNKTILYFLVALQTGTMIVSWIPIYNDHRERNPYCTLAQNIETSYAAGDTVIYPSWKDAQITNLYLQNHDTFLQKVDTTIKDKVILGKHYLRKELFNFQNGKLKY